jgi:hypothetical protein
VPEIKLAGEKAKALVRDWLGFPYGRRNLITDDCDANCLPLDDIFDRLVSRDIDDILLLLVIDLLAVVL